MTRNNNYVKIHSRNEGEIFIIKDIKNKSEFENLVEKIKTCLDWYRKRNFDDKVYKLYLANGERINVIFPKQTIAHLLGIKTEYLKSTKLLKGKSSYEILEEICADPYKICKLVSDGHLTYSSFISPYADDKADNFMNNCGINDINSIEFICSYIKEYSFITGKQQLEGDYYICYGKTDGLLILGLKKEGRYYQPMTNRIIDLNDKESKEFLGQLLTNQHITTLSTIMLGNEYGESKKIFYNNEEKIKKVKTLNAYSEEYDATVEVGKDYMFILEKFSKLYNFSKELDDILTFISNTMQNKCPVNLSKLQEKNVTLSESMISMINAYNLSLEKELTSEGANIYAKKTKEERDKLREEFIKIQTELAAAISVNEKLVQENKKLQEDNQRLQEENKAYGDRETRIIKILTRENDVNDEQNH